MPKLKLTINQRLPINSQVHPGKWFLFLDSSEHLSLVLTFPNSEENLIERFLNKTQNALKDAQRLLPDRESFLSRLDEKVKRYGLHCLRDPENLHSLSKIEFSESLFQESQISTKIPEVITPPTEIIEQMQSPPPKPATLPVVQPPSKPLKDADAKPADDPSQENFDFFGFDAPVPVEPVPGLSTQIVMSQDSTTRGPSPSPSPSPGFLASLKIKQGFSKPVRIRFAQYLVGAFTALMFLFMLKLFSEMGSNTVQMGANHVRFSSSHRHHHRV